MKTIDDYKDEFEQIKDESKNKLEDFNELLQQVIVARENAFDLMISARASLSAYDGRMFDMMCEQSERCDEIYKEYRKLYKDILQEMQEL